MSPRGPVHTPSLARPPSHLPSLHIWLLQTPAQGSPPRTPWSRGCSLSAQVAGAPSLRARLIFLMGHWVLLTHSAPWSCEHTHGRAFSPTCTGAPGGRNSLPASAPTSALRGVVGPKPSLSAPPAELAKTQSAPPTPSASDSERLQKGWRNRICAKSRWEADARQVRGRCSQPVFSSVCEYS